MVFLQMFPIFYLGMAVEMGLPAAILFVFWVIVVLATPRKEDVPCVQYFALKAGMLVYSLGLLVGPQLLNTEACGWTMLFAGAILSYGKRPEKELPAKHIAIPVAIVALLAFTGHFLSDYDNAMFKQWKKLQWHQENGWYPQEQDGRWTTLRSTMGIKQGNILDIQWRSALPASPENQRQNIKFYLDDELILSTVATDDRERRFTYYLSDNFNKGALLTVLVDRPFIPSNHFDIDDQRELGIFIKSLKVKTSLQMPVGFYPPEVDADGREFMWSRRESALQLNSSKENKLLLRSLSEKREVNLAVFVNNSFMKNVVLTPGWKELSISPDKLEGKLKDRLGETYCFRSDMKGACPQKNLG